MNMVHITLRLGRELFERLKAAAGRREIAFSEYLRSVLEERMDMDQKDPKVPLRRSEFESKIQPVIRELMIAVYGLEEMVARGFLDPTVSKNADEKFKVKFLKTIGANSREKTNNLMENTNE